MAPREHIDRVLELCDNATQRSPEHGYPPSPHAAPIDYAALCASDPELVRITPEHLAAIFGVPYPATTMPSPNQGACDD